MWLVYLQAAQQGSARGQYLLGQCYEQGTGVARDQERALEFYQQAADQDHEKAKEALERLTAQPPAPPEQPAEKPPERKRFRWPFGRK